jgi:hypothetical protein
MPVAGFGARHWPCPALSRPHAWCGLPRQTTHWPRVDFSALQPASRAENPARPGLEMTHPVSIRQGARQPRTTEWKTLSVHPELSFRGSAAPRQRVPHTQGATEKSTVGMPAAGFGARHWPCPALSRPHAWCGLPRQATPWPRVDFSALQPASRAENPARPGLEMTHPVSIRQGARQRRTTEWKTLSVHPELSFRGSAAPRQRVPHTQGATEKSTVGVPVAGFGARHWSCPALTRPHAWCGLPRWTTHWPRVDFSALQPASRAENPARPGLEMTHPVSIRQGARQPRTTQSAQARQHAGKARGAGMRFVHRG